VNAEQALEKGNARADPPEFREGCCRWDGTSEWMPIDLAGVMAMACKQRKPDATREAPAVILAVQDQLATRESQAEPFWGGGEARIVPMKPGNYGGGKGPCFSHRGSMQLRKF
jgi:hypothetical protein